jgi:hypothetical protein
MFINKVFNDINEVNLFMYDNPNLVIHTQYELNKKIYIKFKLKSSWNGFKY